MKKYGALAVSSLIILNSLFIPVREAKAIAPAVGMSILLQGGLRLPSIAGLAANVGSKIRTLSWLVGGASVAQVALMAATYSEADSYDPANGDVVPLSSLCSKTNNQDHYCTDAVITIAPTQYHWYSYSGGYACTYFAAQYRRSDTTYLNGGTFSAASVNVVNWGQARYCFLHPNGNYYPVAHLVATGPNGRGIAASPNSPYDPVSTYDPSKVDGISSIGSASTLSDPDTPPEGGGETGIPFTSTDGTVYRYSTSGQDQPTVTSAKEYASGEMLLTEMVDNLDGSVESTEIYVASDGTITGYETTTQPGRIAPPPTVPAGQTSDYQPVAPVYTPPSTVTTGTAQTTGTTNTQTQTNAETGVTTTTGTIDLTGIAQSGEAHNAAVLVTEAIQNQTNQLNDVPVPSVPDADMPWFDGVFDGILDLSIDLGDTSCPIYSVDVPMPDRVQNITLDQHCQLAADYSGAIASLFGLIWILSAFRIVMEA